MFVCECCPCVAHVFVGCRWGHDDSCHPGAALPNAQEVLHVSRERQQVGSVCVAHVFVGCGGV